MNLTESHCGTDLGLLKTKAVPQGDGHLQNYWRENLYLGRRARHEQTTSFILVLARIEGGPEGVKGISLFIVPKN